MQTRSNLAADFVLPLWPVQTDSYIEYKCL